MKEKFAKLINVKSIVTLMVMGVFCYLAIRGDIKPSEFMVIVTAIITYFFTKSDKKEVTEEYIKPEISE
jgi:flagellar motor component MotA